MPVLSHLHHLFNAEQCQASIHTLRWTLILDSRVLRDQ